MKTIRRGVFETNSSSTHSITICTEDEYNAWKNGKKLYSSWSENLCNIESVPEDEREDWQTYEQYEDDYSLESYDRKYTTSNGDKIVIFGKYGYDG